MIKAIIFDMYETLITHYDCPLYFGTEMAADAGIPREVFLPLWRKTENERTLGKIKTEDVVESILKECGRDSQELLQNLIDKRTQTKIECFNHLHPQIMPMLTALKERDISIGLISNCYFEEADVIRKSELFPYFDVSFLSCEQSIKKPDAEIFNRCINALSVKPEECLYIGDGGSQELEAAEKLGMKALQAVWYLKEGTIQESRPKEEFIQLKNPLEILEYIESP